MSDAVIPVLRLDNADLWHRLKDRIGELVARGAFTLGPELEEFEKAASVKFDCDWAVGTGSGTSALILALRASPLDAGARIGVPANTFFATFEAVVLAGYVPVIVDVDEDYLVSFHALDGLNLEGIIAVHLFGLPVDMPALMRLAARNSWWVLEDCAQAHGATIGGRSVGSFGDVGAFSAYPTKNLGAWGDAGFVVGRDREVEDAVRALRHHGQRTPNLHEVIGATERLDNIQALVLTEKLGLLDTEVGRRRQVAAWYRDVLGVDWDPLPGDRDVRTHAYHQFVIRSRQRDRVRVQLERRGIGTGVHYPVPVHLQPAASGHCDIPSRPRNSERFADEILSLPMYPSLSYEDVSRIGEALIEADRSSGRSLT